MLALIVTKTTNYELHGAVIEAKVRQQRVAPEALLRLKTAHQEHYQTLARLRDLLAGAGIAFDEVSRDFPRPWSKPYDAILTVGGDGTVLAASHQMPAGGLLAGIRSSPSSVGYLCCGGEADLPRLVQALAAGQLRGLSVQRLLARVKRVDTGEEVATEPVLNDFLYTNTNPAATTRYLLSQGARAEAHRSSGIWIATATGSTAAIHAAGGVPQARTDNLFQYRVRELYRVGHTASPLDGGLFDPDLEGAGAPALQVENRCQTAVLAFDGQHGMVELGYGDQVCFKRAAPIELVQAGSF